MSPTRTAVLTHQVLQLPTLEHDPASDGPGDAGKQRHGHTVRRKRGARPDAVASLESALTGILQVCLCDEVLCRLTHAWLCSCSHHFPLLLPTPSPVPLQVPEDRIVRKSQRCVTHAMKALAAVHVSEVEHDPKW